MEWYVVRDTDKLEHHGIDGMHWGERNGPPYPLSREKHNKVVRSANRPQANKESKGFSLMQKLRNKKEYEKSAERLAYKRPTMYEDVEKFKKYFNYEKENTAILKAATELPEYKQYQKNLYDYDEYMYKKMYTNPESKRRVYDSFDGEIDYEETYILNNDGEARKKSNDMWKSRNDLQKSLNELAIKYTGEPDKAKFFTYTYTDNLNKKHKTIGQYRLINFCDDDYAFNMRSPEKDMDAWNKLEY